MTQIEYPTLTEQEHERAICAYMREHGLLNSEDSPFQRPAIPAGRGDAAFLAGSPGHPQAGLPRAH